MAYVSLAVSGSISKPVLLVISLVAISHLYNAIFKAKGILGSLTLPLGIGLLSVFGALAVSGTVPRLVWYAFAATTLYDFGTHITTTFKDISRDKELGIVTTPLQIGIRPALPALGSCDCSRFRHCVFAVLVGTRSPKILYYLGDFRHHRHRCHPYFTLPPTEREKWLSRAEGLDDWLNPLFSVSHRCPGPDHRFCRSHCNRCC